MTLPAAIDQTDPFISQRGFSHAVRRVMPNLRIYARRLTRNEADTDDLVQDTLVRAWAARERFEIGTNLKAWLMRIARNSFLSGKRKDRRSVSWDPAIAERLLIAPATQDEGIFSNELNQAVSSLSDGQRVAFELVTRDGLTFEEAADRLGVRSCPTAWCSFSGVAALISGHGRVDHAAMDDNVTAGSSLNCVTLSSVM